MSNIPNVVFMDGKIYVTPDVFSKLKNVLREPDNQERDEVQKEEKLVDVLGRKVYDLCAAHKSYQCEVIVKPESHFLFFGEVDE